MAAQEAAGVVTAEKSKRNRLRAQSHQVVDGVGAAPGHTVHHLLPQDQSEGRLTRGPRHIAVDPLHLAVDELVGHQVAQYQHAATPQARQQL